MANGPNGKENTYSRVAYTQLEFRGGIFSFYCVSKFVSIDQRGEIRSSPGILCVSGLSFILISCHSGDMTFALIALEHPV